jgi:hypothetical protein
MRTLFSILFITALAIILSCSKFKETLKEASYIDCSIYNPKLNMTKKFIIRSRDTIKNIIRLLNYNAGNERGTKVVYYSESISLSFYKDSTYLGWVYANLNVPEKGTIVSMENRFGLALSVCTNDSIGNFFTNFLHDREKVSMLEKSQMFKN